MNEVKTIKGEHGQAARALPAGTIDCDLHHPNPTVEQLLPHLEPVWRDLLTSRGIAQFDTIAYPPNAPLSCRPDWRQGDGTPSSDASAVVVQVLDGFGAEMGILNNLAGVHMLYDAYMADGVTRALNDWTRVEWLDRDARLKASIIPPLQDIAAAVREVDRCAADHRFVQVLLPSAAHVPYGHRMYWPLYEAAVRHGLTIGIHSGSAYHHPVTSLGWPNTVSEDYAAQSQIMQSQLASLVAEGVFVEFPGLKIVFLESGVTWLPAFLWRFGKFWKGLQFEAPWVNRPPAEIIREHVHLTAQPFDAPADAETVAKLLDMIGSGDMLLYASDYPHWQFDGNDVLPTGFDGDLVRRICHDNPRKAYSRLSEATS